MHKPLNGFPVTSPAMTIAITKCKKLNETKVGKWRTAFLQSQLVKFTLISIYKLWRKQLWDYILVNRQNGDQKAGPFESNIAKFSQSRHRSFR